MASGKMRQGVVSCLFGKNGSHGFLRGVLTGAIIGNYMVQTLVHSVLDQAVKAGELPWFTTDTVIITISIAQALLAPLLAWMGYTRRRIVILASVIQLAVFMYLLLIVAPDGETIGNEFCNGNVSLLPAGMTGRGALKLVICLGVGLSTTVSLSIAWCQIIGYMAENTMEGIVSHIGILVAVRLLGLLFIPGTISGTNFILPLVGLTIHKLVLLLQAFKIPDIPPGIEVKPHDPAIDRGFLVSLGRVLSNGVAMAQMVSMGLLAASLWVFGRFESDLIKVLYHQTYSSNWMAMYSDILRYHVVILVIVYASSQFTKPVMQQYSTLSAAKLSMMMCLMVAPLYVVLVTVFQCQQGEVAGLTSQNYTQPACSTSCGCSPPLDVFSPVCAVDSMTTYLSPCQAGCARADNISGIPFLTNCGCAGATGRVTIGACSQKDCSVPFELHKLVYLAVLTLTMLALAKKNLVLLHVVGRADRAVALGLSITFVSLIAFGFAHGGAFAAKALTCAWSKDSLCQLQNASFPYFIGGICAGTALLSGVIAIFIFCKLRRQKTMLDLQMQDQVEMD